MGGEAEANFGFRISEWEYLPPSAVEGGIHA
jgi:hypothetical protein